MADRPVKVVAAACDGACSGNPGPGGWGALLRFEDGSVQELGGADKATTNNRMELTAALALLECLKEMPRDPALVIRTCSTATFGSSWIAPAWPGCACSTCVVTAAIPTTTAATPSPWPSPAASCRPWRWGILR